MENEQINATYNLCHIELKEDMIMELVRKFNVDLDATDAIGAINTYVDKLVQKSSNSYIKLGDLSSKELSDIYKQLILILSNEQKRLSGEDTN